MSNSTLCIFSDKYPRGTFSSPFIPFFDGPGLPLAVDDGVVDEVVFGDRRVVSTPDPSLLRLRS